MALCYCSLVILRLRDRRVCFSQTIQQLFGPARSLSPCCCCRRNHKSGWSSMPLFSPFSITIIAIILWPKKESKVKKKNSIHSKTADGGVRRVWSWWPSTGSVQREKCLLIYQMRNDGIEFLPRPKERKRGGRRRRTIQLDDLGNVWNIRRNWLSCKWVGWRWLWSVADSLSKSAAKRLETNDDGVCDSVSFGILFFFYWFGYVTLASKI